MPSPDGREDEFARGNGVPDPRERSTPTTSIRDIFLPDLLIDRLR